MTDAPTVTAFLGHRRLATGTPWEVALAIRHAGSDVDAPFPLLFDDRTGRGIDLDLRGDEEEMVARLRARHADVEGAAPDTDAAAPTRARGRPRLGVVAREVTLLPRHWDWLAGRPEGASAAIRRLIDAARAAEAGGDRLRQAQAAADRFMMAMLGDQPGWEEASRALYAGDAARFLTLTEGWPADPRDYARRLAAPAFSQAESVVGG